jgi:hypothetical protein
LKIVRPRSQPYSEARASLFRHHRAGTIAIVLVTSLLCSGFRSCGDISKTSLGGSPGPTSGQVAGVVVGVGAVVAVVTLVSVQQSDHTLKGCVYADASGLRLLTSDSKLYAIDGDVAAVKAGDKVTLHGSRVKRAKNSTDPQTFVVKKLRKDYGPCRVPLAQQTKPDK